jgi:phage tail protein X
MATILPAATVTVEAEDMTVGLVCFDYACALLRDRKQAGKLTGYVEATLTANVGLAAKGLILPYGTVITLPEFVIETASEQTERLWDE